MIYIPNAHYLSRFLDALGHPEHYRALRDIFDSLVKDLGVTVEDMWKHTAGDSTALKGKAKKNPQPSGGRKEYKDEDGKVVKVSEGFGYKLHLPVDVKHEVALAYHDFDTKMGDNEGVAPQVEQAGAKLGCE